MKALSLLLEDGSFVAASTRIQEQISIAILESEPK